MRSKLKGLPPMYPVLVGTYWVLALYSTNIELLPTFGVVVVPLVVTIGLTLGIWGVVQLVLKDWGKSALVVACLVLVSLSYGHIYCIVPIGHPLMVTLWIVLAVCGSILVVKGTKPVGRKNLTIVFNIVSICIVLVVLTNVGVSRVKAGSVQAETSPVVLAEAGRALPDVYYIVPDSYASFHSLDTYYGYDNSEFLTYLRDKGFYVVEDAYCNYPGTIMSLPSSLNMRYLTCEEVNRGFGGYLLTVIEYNRLGWIFRGAGYQYIHLGSWASISSYNSNADVNLVFSGLTEFPWTLYETTIFYPIGQKLVGFSRDSNIQEGDLKQFEYLIGIPERGESTFTFAHILLPHAPYIFGSDGKSVTADSERQQYLDQLDFTTGKLRDVVDAILDLDTSSIIVLQSDEGPYSESWVNYWTDHKTYSTIAQDNPELLRSKMGILYAVYLPGVPRGELRSLKSPVNTFRVIFNYLFGMDLGILPDRYYIRDQYKYPVNLVDVTEVIENGNRK